MARSLANRLGLVHIELDAIYHQPQWQPLESNEFVCRVDEVVREAGKGAGWVMCGGYGQHIDHIRDAHADTVIWLDYAKPLVMRRLVGRTVRRAVTREELWNGNREPITNFTSWDPEKNVVRWSWVNFERRREQYQAKIDNGTWDNAAVHRFCTPAEADRFLAAI